MRISAASLALLGLGGLGAGLAGSIAGLASLVSYPVLLAVGLPPVTANVTNTVALVFSSIGSVSGSRPELRGQGPRLRRLGGAAVAGGVVGGALLLSTPAASFERLVPVLIGVASVAILLQPRPARGPQQQRTRDAAAVLPGVFLVGIYGGYFGAAAGVLMLALFLHATGEPLARSNATKNAVLGMANGVAALGFMIFGPVTWSAAAPLAVGFLLGGRLGPIVVRRAPVQVLRLGIAAAGLALAITLGWRTYR